MPLVNVTALITPIFFRPQTVFSAETSTPVVPAGTWTHVSCTYTATGGKSEIYVNGVLKKQEFTGSGILSQVNTLRNRASPLKLTNKTVRI